MGCWVRRNVYYANQYSMTNPTRCRWAANADDLDKHYHDHEWGVPVFDDDRHLFEMLILEGAQAGLSWSTVLKKRASYKLAYDNFDIAKVAAYDDAKQLDLLANPGIVRNKLKVKHSINNARGVLEIQAQHGSFSNWLWNFVDGKPIVNHFQSVEDVPVETDLSKTISKALKKKGFGFVGPTIIYAYMQGVGMTMDHTVDCFRYGELIRTV